jgi:ATP-dependent Clp protease ATP-binding subunit ClpA
MEGYRFTDDARASLALAREESARLQHEYVGTEHLLLGILRLSDGGATDVLRDLALDVEATRAMINDTVKRGAAPIAGDRALPYTSRARTVLNLATTAMRELSAEHPTEAGQAGVGSEHLLLGILREQQGIAAQVLVDQGLTESAVRETILRLRAARPTGSRPTATMDESQPSSGPLRPVVMGYHFTQNVRTMLAYAREEAARLHHEYVGTEHMLLGLLKRTQGVGYSVLEALSVDFDGLKELIERTVKQGRAAEPGGPDLPYTSRAKKVLELAMDEARHLGHSYVGSEHLLLGLIREEKGIAAQVLARAGVTLDTVRAGVVDFLSERAPEQEGVTSERRTPARETPSLVIVEVRYERSWTRRREFRTVEEARAFLAQL